MTFNDCGYLVVPSAIDEGLCKVFTKYALLDEVLNPNLDSLDVPDTHFKTADLFTTSIMITMMPMIEDLVGMSLLPTSSHFRVYRQGSILQKHHDQEHCCQVTASITMGASFPDGYRGWPVYLEDEPFYIDVGDMLLFNGHQLFHSRKKLDIPKEYYQVQVFMHYIEKDSEIIEQYRGIEGIKFYGN